MNEMKKERIENLYRYSDLSVEAIAQQVDMEPSAVQNVVDGLAKEEAVEVLVEQSFEGVEKIMSSTVVSIEASKTAEEAAALMAEKKVGSVIVTKDGRPFGIVTHSDVVNWVGMQEKPFHAKLEGLASRPLITGGSNTSIEEAAEMMIKNKIHKLPIVDRDRLVGIVTITDLAGFLSPSRRPGLSLSVLRAVSRGEAE